jgi:hypothetical protein
MRNLFSKIDLTDMNIEESNNNKKKSNDLNKIVKIAVPAFYIERLN